jgi:hypothetical protein
MVAWVVFVTAFLHDIPRIEEASSFQRSGSPQRRYTDTLPRRQVLQPRLS